MDKKTALTTQLFMTCLMAFSMSGLMSVVEIGPTALWLSHWPRAFLMAWPTAFVMTMLAWPIASLLARMVLGAPRPDDQPAE